MKELNTTKYEVISSVLSYDHEYQASIVEECKITDRKDKLSQELEDFALDRKRPIRAIKCRKKQCSQMDFSTDLKLNDMENSDKRILAGVPKVSTTFFVTSYKRLADREGNVYLSKKCPTGTLASFVSREAKLTYYTHSYQVDCNCGFLGCCCDRCNRSTDLPTATVTRRVDCIELDDDAGFIVHDNDTKNTGWVSSGDSGSETAMCPENYYVGGMECEKNSSWGDNCNTMRLICKRIEVNIFVCIDLLFDLHSSYNEFLEQILPQYSAVTSLRLYSKSNDWGEHTGIEELRTLPRPVTNFKIPDSQFPRACISPEKYNINYFDTVMKSWFLTYRISNEDWRHTRGKWTSGDSGLGITGLGFSFTNDDVFYYQSSKIKERGITADETFLPVVVKNFTPSGNAVVQSKIGGVTISRPSEIGSNTGFGELSTTYGNPFKFAAVNAPRATHEKISNSGAVVFYEKHSTRGWIFDGVVYGAESNHQLGKYSLNFLTGHILEVYSNHHGVDYISNVLSECPKHAKKKGPLCICEYGYLAVNHGETLTRSIHSDDYCTLSFFSSIVIPKVENEKNVIEVVIKNGFDNTNANQSLRFPAESKYESYENWNNFFSLSQASEDSNNPEPINPVYSTTFTVKKNPNNDIIFTFSGLIPGKKYLAKFTNFQSPQPNVDFPIIPSCSCQSLTNPDQTGRPRNLVISQDRGHVQFKFLDNSKCENGFSFTRFKGYAEFVDDSSSASSFSKDYSYQAPTQCGSDISPVREASDDLKLSLLPVGNIYSYCVRAVKNGGYMDIAPNAEEVRSVSSSSALCKSHEIAWESSISGLVSTEPNAGTIAIKDVKVRWQLLSEETLQPISCPTCTGEEITDKGGIFEIKILVQEEIALHGKNDAEIPIKLFFSKTTTSDAKEIPHRFLCNEGQDICDDSEGFITYVKHLHFDLPIHIYDDTSVPFTGQLTIHGTKCPIMGAKACPLHKRVSAELEDQNALTGTLCVETDSDGFFTAPVVIGSVIYGVRFEYHEHEFKKTFENTWNYDQGVVISEGGFYAKNDYQDITKARLIVQGKVFDAYHSLKRLFQYLIIALKIVAGGLCDLALGKSDIEIRVKGCAAELHEGGILEETKKQSSFEATYTDVPAHFLEVKVTKVEGQTQITEFFNGADPVVRTISLLETGEEDKQENALIDTPDDGDTGEETSEVKDKSAYKTSEKRKETVRFQYDGTLELEVEVTRGDTLTCADYAMKDEDDRSFHVVDYMTLIEMSIQVRYKVLENTYCNYVDPDTHKLSIESNLGMDRNGGFAEFFDQLPDGKQKEMISICSTIAPPNGQASGPCLIQIDSSKEFSGKKKFEMTVGRPNISKGVEEPYFSKNVNIRVVGGANNVQHRADFFVEGQFSKGAGDSFAFPTHQPVMVLRDPPVSFENC